MKIVAIVKILSLEQGLIFTNMYHIQTTNDKNESQHHKFNALKHTNSFSDIQKKQKFIVRFILNLNRTGNDVQNSY